MIASMQGRAASVRPVAALYSVGGISPTLTISCHWRLEGVAGFGIYSCFVGYVISGRERRDLT